MATIFDIPINLLLRILSHFDYREKVRLERVCHLWRNLLLNHGWTKFRRLRFTYEMLELEEPWRHYSTCQQNADKLKEKFCELFNSGSIQANNKQNPNLKRNLCAGFLCTESINETFVEFFRHNKSLYKQKRDSRKLGALSGIVRRSGKYLQDFQLIGIDCQTRFGRLLKYLRALRHLHISAPLDQWHLEKIAEKWPNGGLQSVILTPKPNAVQTYVSLIEQWAPHLILFGITQHPGNLFLPAAASLEMPLLRFFCLKYLSEKKYHESSLSLSMGPFLQNICRNSPHLEVLMVESRGFEFPPVGDIDFSELAQKLRGLVLRNNDFNIDSFFQGLKLLKQPSRMKVMELPTYKIDIKTLFLIARKCPLLEHLSIEISFVEFSTNLAKIKDVLPMHLKRLRSVEFNLAVENFYPLGYNVHYDLEFEAGIIDLLRTFGKNRPLEVFCTGAEVALSESFVFEIAREFKALKILICRFESGPSWDSERKELNTAELKRVWKEHELTEAEAEHPFEYYFPIRDINNYETDGQLAAIRDYPKGLEVRDAADMINPSSFSSSYPEQAIVRNFVIEQVMGRIFEQIPDYFEPHCREFSEYVYRN